ncbi:GGDEF domain-containing protein [Pseudomonas sp. PDM13]|uniref:GGDEF domain-containing protein n=1 Tax=Pseudomonas sp. PDM13 TaxID=2769255 RepID=UPI0021E0AD96|nr:GGDEF domain-containing protein [Pseudomonas sp. PDM13]MCU9946319.1 GGDEF domain-containing protein [Pseudomonas sp. PDM13]
MSDDGQRWKEKYLQSLEQQEKLERRWDARLDLLRRGLVRSSLAAEGSDKAVDQCMQELREIIRGDQIDAGLSALIPRLEKAVLDSEQRRQQRVEQNVGALTGLTNQLLKLEVPRDVRKSLKQFAKRIDERASQAREMPAMLGELSDLQRRALDELANSDAATPKPGLLQRLFGSQGDVAEDAPPAAAALPTGDALAPPPAVPAPAALQAAPQLDDEPAQPAKAPAAAPAPGVPPTVEPAPVAAAAAPAPAPAPAQAPAPVPTAATEQAVQAVAEAAPVVAPLVPEVAPAAPAEPLAAAVPAPVTALAGGVSPSLSPRLDSLPLPAALITGEGDPSYALPTLPEPGYSAVAPHVAASLRGLLDELELPERHKPQGEALRERLVGGLNWYELVPVLDDLAVLVLAVTDSEHRDFAIYLKQLNERLVTFVASISAAHEGYSETLESARVLDDQLREQVSDLQSSVQDATDLDDLKLSVEQRLDGLLNTMNDYQRQRDAREEEVGGRLKVLVERVATMEQEASSFRDHLEEQRQKALSDTLTGLPNRAAWSERLELEVARWKRYGGELLLAVLDIDHFKRINDNYGHLAGDKVLKIIAGEIAKRLRKTDFIARFGGEEFVLLIPATPLEGGQQLLDTLRSAIEQCPFHFKGEPVTITLSGGLVSFVEGEKDEQTFERADQALYRAKREGRNRIELG